MRKLLLTFTVDVASRVGPGAALKLLGKAGPGLARFAQNVFKTTKHYVWHVWPKSRLDGGQMVPCGSRKGS